MEFICSWKTLRIKKIFVSIRDTQLGLAFGNTLHRQKCAFTYVWATWSLEMASVSKQIAEQVWKGGQQQKDP